MMDAKKRKADERSVDALPEPNGHVAAPIAQALNGFASGMAAVQRMARGIDPVAVSETTDALEGRR